MEFSLFLCVYPLKYLDAYLTLDHPERLNRLLVLVRSSGRWAKWSFTLSPRTLVHKRTRKCDEAPLVNTHSHTRDRVERVKFQVKRVKTAQRIVENSIRRWRMRARFYWTQSGKKRRWPAYISTHPIYFDPSKIELKEREQHWIDVSRWNATVPTKRFNNFFPPFRSFFNPTCSSPLRRTPCPNTCTKNLLSNV